MKYASKKYNNLKYSDKIISRLMLYFNTTKIIILAELLGVSQPTISNWKKRGTIDMERIIEKAQNINLNWLFFGEGTMLRQSDIASDRTASYLVSPEELRRLRSLEKKVKELQEFL